VTLIWGLRVVFLLLLVGVSAAALMPPGLQEDQMGWLPNDKLMHGVAYATVSTAGLLAFPRWSVVRVMTLLLVHGVGIELVQPLTGRVADLQDILANLAGLVLGAGLVWISGQRPKPR
jgi:VanZ family protein